MFLNASSASFGVRLASISLRVLGVIMPSFCNSALACSITAAFFLFTAVRLASPSEVRAVR